MEQVKFLGLDITPKAELWAEIDHQHNTIRNLKEEIAIHAENVMNVRRELKKAQEELQKSKAYIEELLGKIAQLELKRDARGRFIKKTTD